uniref:Uncharacterized protein n=1 Tax=Lactuca sativa TaxID=4236 RepID=A0A9R1UZ43_LACSA|nr:hypothetical protein LSAT_V11C700373400 [Lactuca sativa]
MTNLSWSKCMNSRDKYGKVRSNVHHVSAGGSGHKTKFGGQNKRNMKPKKQSFKKPSHQNPNSNLKEGRTLPHLLRDWALYERLKRSQIRNSCTCSQESD